MRGRFAESAAMGDVSIPRLPPGELRVPDVEKILEGTP